VRPQSFASPRDETFAGVENELRQTFRFLDEHLKRKEVSAGPAASRQTGGMALASRLIFLTYRTASRCVPAPGRNVGN
jgi:hypothetical protein